jgi:hypothetical protein
MLKNTSDIDLTILYKSKADIHPSFFARELKQALSNQTKQTWNHIQSNRLYLLNSMTEDKVEIEI